MGEGMQYARGGRDSTGKSKIGDAKARNSVLSMAFLVGLCLGVIVSERAYVYRSRRQQPATRSLLPHPKALHTGGADAGSLGSQHIGAEDGGALASNRSPSPPPMPKLVKTPAMKELEELLLRIAPQREVLVALANKNLLWDAMLRTFGNGLKGANVTNHLILALDQETLDFCKSEGLNGHRMNVEDLKVQLKTGDNHAVSAMKYQALKHFIELGWAVMLSDVDIAVLQNPFEHLYRDSDVEGMTDGFNERLAYGAIEGFTDPSMGWSQYAQLYQHFNFNSGLFYLRANPRTLELLTRLATRLATTVYWDQTAFNEEIFFLSHGSYKSPQVSVRVMDIDVFMNSKRLFKDVRHRAVKPPKPVTVHINYHPDKHNRMKAVFKYYNGGDLHALDPFPGGSEKGTRRLI